MLARRQGFGRGRAAAAGLALLALAGLVGCAESPPPAPGAPSLAAACAVRTCQCLSESIPLFLKRESRPIEWQPNGDAACPEGFKLVPVEQPK
jgi:hypothetical protein